MEVNHILLVGIQSNVLALDKVDNKITCLLATGKNLIIVTDNELQAIEIYDVIQMYHMNKELDNNAFEFKFTFKMFVD